MGVIEGMVVAALAGVLHGALPAWNVADLAAIAPHAGKELNGLLRPAFGPPARPSLHVTTEVTR
jgi:hypothetical protein